MNIACISNINKITHPQVPSGQEGWTAHYLAESVKRGNTYDLYAVKGSISRPPGINLIETLPDPYDKLRDVHSNLLKEEKNMRYFYSAIFMNLFTMIRDKQQQYAFIMDNSNYPPLLPNAGLFSIPYIVISHTPSTRMYIRLFEYFPVPKNLFFVFPTYYESSKTKTIPDNQKFHVSHGIDMDTFPFEESTERNNLLWYGRIDKRLPKGEIEAIEVAHKTKFDLDLYCYIEDESYFSTVIKPLLSEHTHIYPNRDRSAFFKHAKLFLFPVQEAELFGLVLLEAMATGTPVVAYARGAAPDVILDGKTGFLVNPSDNEIKGNWIVKKTGIEGLCEAVQRVYALSPEQYRDMQVSARLLVQKQFTIEKMVSNYESIYQQILSNFS